MSGGGVVRSRRRSARAHRAVLDATADLIDRHGFHGVTVDAIARRAGVSKATVYRWWPSKAAVAMDALLAAVTPQLDWPDTGSIRDDLRAQLDAVRRLLSDPRTGGQIVGIIAAAQADPELASAFRDRFLQPRRAASRQAFRRAIHRGQLRPDMDVDVAIDVLYGPLYYRLLVGHQPLDDALPDALVDHVLRALQPAAPGE